jgi:uncharacterized membrane protein
MAFARFFRHLFTTRAMTARRFPPRTLDAIEAAIRQLESTHRGELRFVVEAALDMGPLWQQVSPRERALQTFALQRVWDTEHNNGVLLYVLMADHAVEIVSDRGIASRTDTAQWEEICHGIEAAFGEGRFEQGAVEGITALGSLLGRHYPAVDIAEEPRNELPDRPTLI